jgi:hypothetical protein
VIGAGSGSTIKSLVRKQPEDNAYVTVIVPAVPASTLPVLLIVATDGSLTDQVPPTVPLVSGANAPSHASAIPAIGAGIGSTVAIAVVIHEVGNVYVIVVVPILMPVTTPVLALTDARAGTLLDHTPPASASPSVEVAFTHISEIPDIGAGVGLTVRFVLT